MTAARLREALVCGGVFLLVLMAVSVAYDYEPLRVRLMIATPFALAILFDRLVPPVA